MATAAEWVAGARPRTLPAAFSPVLAGTGAAYAVDAGHVGRALLALVVALALQVGVNYANDYSDGIRGTDEVRVGPVRLVGQRLAEPAAVKRAAFAAFGVGAVAGLVLVALSGAWWLIAVGAACILAAWYYTGGDRPYGYSGLGEVYVFVFFGLVATLGTQFTQAGRITWVGVLAAVGVGALASAILVANNLRDIPSDTEHGKRTLAVRWGDERTRSLYGGLLVTAYVVLFPMLLLDAGLGLLAIVSFLLAWKPARTVRRGAAGRDLIPVLAATGQLELAYAVLLGIGLVLS